MKREEERVGERGTKEWGSEWEQQGGGMLGGNFGRKMVIVQLASIKTPLKNYFIFPPQTHTVNGISALCPCCHNINTHTHMHTHRMTNKNGLNFTHIPILTLGLSPMSSQSLFR